MREQERGTATRKPDTKLVATMRSLMDATGLSEDSCRDHLAAGTWPKNPVIARVWDAEMKRMGIRKPIPRGPQRKQPTEWSTTIRSLKNATGLSGEMCRQHLAAGTLPHNPLLAAAWYAAMRRLGLRCPKPPSNRTVKERSHRSTPYGALMSATGLSEESCRTYLAAGTRPKNPIIAVAWDTELKRTGARRQRAPHSRTASRSTELVPKLRSLMDVTGLCEKMCRNHLAAGTRPKNPIIAAAWDAQA